MTLREEIRASLKSAGLSLRPPFNRDYMQRSKAFQCGASRGFSADVRCKVLIYGSAIKTSHKPQRISYLQISNRRFSQHLPFTPRTTASLHHFSFHGIMECFAFTKQHLDALRRPHPVRGRHPHLLRRAPLRHHRPERRRQVHVHEDSDRRNRAVQGRRHAAEEARRPAPGPVRLRRVSRDRHGHHGQRPLWKALEERESSTPSRTID